MAQKIFVVEDDDNIREMLLYALRSAGFTARGHGSGTSFWFALQSDTPDLVLLDIMLPGEDGLSILQRLRTSKSTASLPVIMLTAKTKEFDRVRGLDWGADDYILKPFSVLEVIARVKAVLRRVSAPSEDGTIAVGGLLIDPGRRAAFWNDQELSLTYKEFELLYRLMANSGFVLSRSRLIAEVWGYDYIGESRTVDMHVKSLRQKLGEGAALIKTVRNVGYKIGEKP